MLDALPKISQPLLTSFPFLRTKWMW
jgi:hypothetical protein